MRSASSAAARRSRWTRSGATASIIAVSARWACTSSPSTTASRATTGSSRPPVDDADLEVGSEQPEMIGRDAERRGVAEVRVDEQQPRAAPTSRPTPRTGGRRPRAARASATACRAARCRGRSCTRRGSAGAPAHRCGRETASHSAVRDDRVGAGREVGTVLLGRADGHQAHLAAPALGEIARARARPDPSISSRRVRRIRASHRARR